MKDRFGRNINYMRISITDRCNLRCRYCMPYGIECVPRWNILTMEEFLAAAAAGAAVGISRIRVTGGEPLLRRDCVSLIRELKRIPGIEQVTISTNGILLGSCLGELIDAGIDGINISLDTLDRELYRQITGTDGLYQVLGAVKELSDNYKGIRVKINAVSSDFACLRRHDADAGRESFIRTAVTGGAVDAGGGSVSGSDAAARSAGIKAEVKGPGLAPDPDDDVRDLEDKLRLCELARGCAVDIRFIEMMPIGFGRDFAGLDNRDIFAALKIHYPDIERDISVHGNGPAVYYHIPGFKGSIGFISAIHGRFCADCNRIRLTSMGFLKPCLCYGDGMDIRRIMRGGEVPADTDRHYCWPAGRDPYDSALKEELIRAFSQVLSLKPGGHCFEDAGSITERAAMSAIGG